ncbi:hypothetical protein D3C73_823470 [compost metagenome]
METIQPILADDNSLSGGGALGVQAVKLSVHGSLVQNRRVQLLQIRKILKIGTNLPKSTRADRVLDQIIIRDLNKSDLAQGTGCHGRVHFVGVDPFGNPGDLQPDTGQLVDLRDNIPGRSLRKMQRRQYGYRWNLTNGAAAAGILTTASA